MLVEERSGADEVECYSIWAVSCICVSAKEFLWVGRGDWVNRLVLSRDGGDGTLEEIVGGGRTNIFIASSCSFLGMISSMCGARRG